MNTKLKDRDLRQRGLVPPERLSQCRATVVGVGAIGRQVALQLAAIGIPWLQLIDHDIVEEVNLAPQGYLEDDLSRNKVHATGDMAQQINHSLEVDEVSERFKRSMKIGNVLFCAVDDIGVRKFIWDAVKDRVSIFIDGRMNAEVIRVLAASDSTSRDHYPTTFFSSEEAVEGSCTAKSTIYTANIAAGLMIQQFTKWLRGMVVDPDLCLNLLAGELTVPA